MDEVTVVPGVRGGWAWQCLTHGRAVVAWIDHSMAAYDALGHIAHHHPAPLPSET